MSGKNCGHELAGLEIIGADITTVVMRLERFAFIVASCVQRTHRSQVMQISVDDRPWAPKAMDR